MTEEETLSRILKEIENTKKELKNKIEESEKHILNELQTKIKNLETENHCLRRTIEDLEIKNRKNNIILFGLQKEIVKDIPKLCQKLNELLNIRLTESEINDAYCLGKTENPPIKVELISQLKKKQIIQNTKSLKGTNIYISNDLTKNQQQELKILKRHLHILREEEPETNSYIRGNKLFIDYKGYTTTQLEDGIYKLKSKRRNNSAPASPTVRRNQEDDIFTTIQQETFDQISREKTSTSKQEKSQEQTIKSREPKQTPRTNSSNVDVGGITHSLRTKSQSSPAESKMTTRQGRRV